MKKALMFQGTASNVGKSILTAGFCRIFLEDGLSVAPFKAQNMALNSFVTEDGLEMGRAQATQAAACRIKPDVHMNPILLKPSAEGCQRIIMGKPENPENINNNFAQSSNSRKILEGIIRDSYEYLAARYDLVVIEGAGSPAEVNLKANDLVNMHVAKMAQSPVIIVGDIDKGGVYAHFAGTFDLLDPGEQELTAGFIINKFRGDASQLTPANEFIEKRTGRKIFGVVPMIRDLNLPDEDSVEFKKNVGRNPIYKENQINIALIDLPHISNFTDIDPLRAEADVNLFAINKPEDILNADIIIIPGSKNTMWDLNYLKKSGFEEALRICVKHGKTLIGICGGFQMLGKHIHDPIGVESGVTETTGFGFLDMDTVMSPEKTLTQVTAICTENGLEVKGYEIHHGRTEMKETVLFTTGKGENHETVLGCKNTSGNVWGTYIHGIFDSDTFRTEWLNRFRQKKHMKIPQTIVKTTSLDSEITRLASILRTHTDIPAIYRILNI